MRLGGFVVVAALATGCVSKGKYAELETSYNQAVTDRDAAQADAAAAAKELEELRAKNRARLEAFSSVYAELLEIEAKGLAKVRIEDGRAVLQLDSDVLFASGSAALTASGKTAVQSIAKDLAKGSGEYQVEGHTDTDAIKSKEFPSNWHLGGDRAINVVLAMVEAGLPSSRVSAATFGQEQPVAGNDTADGKKENRRIEVVWVPELSEMLPYKKMMKQLKEKSPAPAE